jgi:protease I
MEEGKRYRISSLEALNIDQVDCLLFPGGYSPDALRLHAGTLRMVRECHKQGKLLAAICHGPWVLISAGIMAGKKATGYAAVRDDLVNAGAEFLDVPAVKDGNILTGRVPDDLPEFCQEIIKALAD